MELNGEKLKLEIKLNGLYLCVEAMSVGERQHRREKWESGFVFRALKERNQRGDLLCTTKLSQTNVKQYGVESHRQFSREDGSGHNI